MTDVTAPIQTDEQQGSNETEGPKNISELLQKRAHCFRDQHQNPMVAIGSLIYEARSKQLKAKIYALAKIEFGIELANKEIKKLVYNLEMRSRNGEQIELNNRFAQRGKSLMLDLGGSKLVAVNAEGWRVCEKKEPVFKSYSHQCELPTPVEGQDLDALFEHLDLTDPSQQLLVVAWLVSAMIPSCVTPMLLVTGEQGSGKTTFSKLLRSILDPSQIPLLGDLDLRDWFLVFENHAIPVFENVGKFDSRMADIFCRAVTGAGIQRRMLYTNSETVIYQFHCPIIINGVNLPSQRPDFLDRVVHLELKRHRQFKPTHIVWDGFQQKLPVILGGLLDLVVKVFQQLDGTEPNGNSRMSDFVRVGRAVAKAFDRSPDEFDRDFKANQDSLLFDIGDSDPLVRAIQLLVSKHPASDPWQGSASKLLSELQGLCRKKSTNISVHEIPKDATRLSGRMTELTTVLAKVGVCFERGKENGKRFLKLWLDDVIVSETVISKGGAK